LSLYWIEKSAQLGNKVALLDLASLVLSGIKTTSFDIGDPLVIVENEELHYDTVVSAFLAKLFALGKMTWQNIKYDIPRNTGKALYWLEKAVGNDSLEDSEAHIINRILLADLFPQNFNKLYPGCRLEIVELYCCLTSNEHHIYIPMELIDIVASYIISCYPEKHEPCWVKNQELV